MQCELRMIADYLERFPMALHLVNATTPNVLLLVEQRDERTELKRGGPNFDLHQRDSTPTACITEKQ